MRKTLSESAYSNELETIRKIGEQLGIGINDWLNKNDLKRIPLRTTNQVFHVNEFIFKNYIDNESFLAEVSIYLNRKRFSFKMPELVGTFVEEGNGAWSVLSYIEGITLQDFLDKYPASDLKKIFSVEVARTIADFEKNSDSIEHIGITNWSMEESLFHLFEFLRKMGCENLVSNLINVIRRGDIILAESSYKPCFDAFFKNILITFPKKKNVAFELVHCDFDKSFRRIPQGESLSHISISERLSPFLDDALIEYSRWSDVSKETALQILKITSFARCLAGLRDAVRRVESEDESIELRRQRIAIANWSIKCALQLIEEFSKTVNLQNYESQSLEELLLMIYEKLNHKKYLT
jgi:hypothetical protein